MRSRSEFWLPPLMLAALVVGCLALGWPAAAGAQGFLQGLFGGSAALPRPQASPVLPPAVRIPVALPPPFVPARLERDREASRPAERGNQRTVCVRLCDGYYWPVSQSAGRVRIIRDEAVCASSCASDTRLFRGGQTAEIAGMVDAAGRGYTALANAFRYRKTLVHGCSCKPEPWSETELNRHRHYAAVAGPAPGVVVAGVAADANAESGEVATADAATTPGPAEKAPVGSGPAADRPRPATGGGQRADTHGRPEPRPPRDPTPVRQDRVAAPIRRGPAGPTATAATRTANSGPATSGPANRAPATAGWSVTGGGWGWQQSKHTWPGDRTVR